MAKGMRDVRLGNAVGSCSVHLTEDDKVRLKKHLKNTKLFKSFVRDVRQLMQFSPKLFERFWGGEASMDFTRRERCRKVL